MSPTDTSMPGIKGKRVPGRPGRFDPSQPLHMTTRRAAKIGPSNGSPSVNGSVDEDESRRGSFDDTRPVTSHSNGSQFSIRSRRPSEVSLPIVSPDVAVNGLLSSEERKGDVIISKPLSPYQQTPSPTRKRKRSSSPTAFEAVQLFQPPPHEDVDTTFENDYSITEFKEEGDTAELVPPEDLSDHEVSERSYQSEEDNLQHGAFPIDSMDVTPAVSNPTSPESGGSGSREDQAVPEVQTLGDIDQEPEDEIADAVDDMDVDGDGDVDVEGVDDADDADEQLRSDDDERPARRFGGRRRAQHPVPKVEKAMQRQAELKSAYRALARAQKAVLAEIAQRTLDGIDSNPEMHLHTVEYQGVKDGLDDALESRQQRLRAQLQLNMEQLTHTLEAEQRAIRKECAQKLEDLKEFRLATLEYEMMRVMREAQKKVVEAGEQTDDEEEATSKAETRALTLGMDAVSDVYNSRSRLMMGTARVTDDMERRFEMHKLLDGLEEDDRVGNPGGFTIMNDLPRKAATARREGLQNTKVLADAATEFERRSNIPVIPNKDALGLQLLGDLASRPSITAPSRESLLRSSRRRSLSRQTPSKPVPPQLHIPKNQRPSPIPVEMSPRTTQALGDRFENSMPPPVTPRRATNLLMRSPEALRPEQTLPSPTFNANRFTGSQEFPVRTPDRWPESRRPTFSDHSRAPLETQKQPEPKQNAQFSPPHPNERRMDYPLWREYPGEAPSNLHRRGSSSHGERPPFNLGAGLPQRDDRRDNIGPRVQERPESQEHIKTESSPFGPLQSRPQYWQDRSSQPGAPDGRAQDQRPSIEPPRRPTLGPQSPPNDRKPAISFTAREFRPGLMQQRDNQDRQKHRVSKSIFQHKTSKEERDGLSRRSWSNQRRFSKSLGNFGSAEPPTNPPSAGSPVERATPALWRGPPQPQHSPPSVPPPPSAPYQQSPYTQPPPPPIYRPAQQGNDHYQPRSSFTPRPASSSQDRLPPTPLYVVPQQHPPPPGVPPEQYNRPFAPPPPPGYQPPPPPPPQAPQTGYSPSAPGSAFSNQFGGPPLAPAGTSSYNAHGFRPAPAFAQQAQQQQQSTFGNRRRTQSDASQFPKFQSWTPPTTARR